MLGTQELALVCSPQAIMQLNCCVVTALFVGQHIEHGIARPIEV